MTNPTHPQQVAKSTSAKKVLMSDLMQTVGILPILILIVAVFGFIAPNFFTESNLLNITRQASINIVLAAGMTFIILTGGIDLSVGAVMAIAGATAASMTVAGHSLTVVLLASLGAGALAGLWNGVLVAVLRLLLRPWWKPRPNRAFHKPRPASAAPNAWPNTTHARAPCRRCAWWVPPATI